METATGTNVLLFPRGATPTRRGSVEMTTSAPLRLVLSPTVLEGKIIGRSFARWGNRANSVLVEDIIA